MTRIVVNGRFQLAPPSGVRRYAQELLRLLGNRVETLRPSWGGSGLAGHLWEQLVLPARLGGRLLWSPGNTGPFFVSHQVVTIHDLAALDHPEWFTRRFALLYRRLIPELVHRVRRVIAVSEFTKARIVAATGVDTDKVVVVPNGVGDSFCPRPVDEIAAVRSALGIPAGRYVLTVSTLEPRKNLPRLLRAWRIAAKQLGDETHLIVAGAAGRRRVFPRLRLPALPPRVRLLGEVAEDHLPALYSGASAFAFVPLYEGFGLPVLEAMACGTPVVVSNTSALPEAAGDAAVTVDPLTEAPIAQGLHRVLTDAALREDLAQRGRARAKEFTWQKAAQATWQILQEAAG